MKKPTATQEVGEVHDTPMRALSCVAEVLGLEVMVQVVPFHVSIRVWKWVLLVKPTATQEEGEVHDTPASKLSFGAEVLGLEVMVQAGSVEAATGVAPVVTIMARPMTAAAAMNVIL